MYYPFESGLMASTAEVYEHEIPGGQYSNLRPQARALGLDDQFELIKKNYAAVNRMFGNLVKVTPSSKVVGDMAMFMTSNGYTEADIYEKGDSLSFPESVIKFFKGDLGQPYQGFPSDLQKIVLKNIEPYTERPNTHLEPVNFDKEFKLFQKEFGTQYSMEDFISYKLYPRVFSDYHDHLNEFGDVYYIPSAPFFYGLRPDEEVLIPLEEGKQVLVRYLHSSDADEDGFKTVYFNLNGQIRAIQIEDKSAVVTKVSHEKAAAENHVGAPLQGLLAKVLVKPGQKVAKDDPLFVIEAMKMESTIVSPQDGEVSRVVLNEGTMVMQNDLIIDLKD